MQSLIQNQLTDMHTSFNFGCSSIKSKVKRKHKRLRVSNEIPTLRSVVEILVMSSYSQDTV